LITGGAKQSFSLEVCVISLLWRTSFLENTAAATLNHLLVRRLWKPRTGGFQPASIDSICHLSGRALTINGG
jgi:hypothetical protein